jgi:hypothetical protein
LLKFSQAISHVSVELEMNISEISSPSIFRADVVNENTSLIYIYIPVCQITALSYWRTMHRLTTFTLMMETKVISETLVFNSKLTPLIALEDFSTYIVYEASNVTIFCCHDNHFVSVVSSR